ncbi:methyltransferase family protein [Marinicellulosiphila megalodicopiae]|uniref:methyltransferase family protein n=1 Tax=Marinicellulosiphila megalodicopiae TaxID=2724896 RepID=UPI003BAE44B1
MNKNTNLFILLKEKLKLKIPPVILVILFGCLMFNASLFLPKFTFDSLIVLTVTAIVLLLSFIFCLSGVLEFRKNQTTVDPRSPEKTSSLVNSAIYSISRNPMYVGFALILVALTCLLQSPFLIVCVFGFVQYMNTFQIIPEEASLSEIFGDEYAQYKTKVRRWL